MNTVCLVGRLVRDPETKYTTSGTAVGRFSLAVDRAGDKQDDGTYAAGFFDVECWEKTAELVEQYLTKGRQVAVEGRLKLHKWESQGGEKRSKVEVVANRVTFVGSRQDQEEDEGGQQHVPAASASDLDSDIPFMATI